MNKINCFVFIFPNIISTCWVMKKTKPHFVAHSGTCAPTTRANKNEIHFYRQETILIPTIFHSPKRGNILMVFLFHFLDLIHCKSSMFPHSTHCEQSAWLNTFIVFYISGRGNSMISIQMLLISIQTFRYLSVFPETWLGLPK